MFYESSSFLAWAALSASVQYSWWGTFIKPNLTPQIEWMLPFLFLTCGKNEKSHKLWLNFWQCWLNGSPSCSSRHSLASVLSSASVFGLAAFSPLPCMRRNSSLSPVINFSLAPISRKWFGWRILMETVRFHISTHMQGLAKVWCLGFVKLPPDPSEIHAT